MDDAKRGQVVERYLGTAWPHRVFADQHEGRSWRELSKDVGLTVEIIPWKGGAAEDSKSTLFRNVRTLMLEGGFRIPDDPDLIREFRATRAVDAKKNPASTASFTLLTRCST